MSINPIVRFWLARQSFVLARAWGRGVAFSLAMAACMLITGRTPKYRIYGVSI